MGNVRERIIANWATSGVICPAERHLGLTDNFSFATVSQDVLKQIVRDVARSDCNAVAIVCTNLDGATIAADLEKEIGRPVFDSISVTLWKCFELLGVDASNLTRWGGPFRGKGDLIA